MWLHRVQQWQLNTFYVVEESVLALLQNPSLTLTSHLRLLWAGEKKFYQVVWVIRNSDSSRDYILRGSEIRNPVPWEISSIGSPHSCTLENQKFSILSCVRLKISLESFWVAFLTPSRFLNSLVEFLEDVFNVNAYESICASNQIYSLCGIYFSFKMGLGMSINA